MPSTLDAVKNRIIANDTGFDWKKSGFEIVYQNWCINVKDASPATLPDFCRKFMGGYENRPSMRVSNKPGTTPDKIIDKLIKARVPQLTNGNLRIVEISHRLSRGIVKSCVKEIKRRAGPFVALFES